MNISDKHRITLVLGGARSGKSRHAQQLAEAAFKRPLYLATAEACDDEMRERIRLHREARGPRWAVEESPLEMPGVLRNPPAECDGILLDCVTVWLGNVLHHEGGASVVSRRAELIAALEAPACDTIVVSNEVGQGLVPEYPLGREFRDHAGWLNQDLARVADTVVFVVAGLPMILKGGVDGGAAGKGVQNHADVG